MTFWTRHLPFFWARILVPLAIALGSLPAARADVIVNTAVTTAQQGDGGAFNVTSDGSINTVANDGITAGSGTIGGNTGVVVEGGGLIPKRTHSATVTGTSGNAIRVAENGVFGDATGVGGVAIASNGAGSAISGRIENRGTVH